MDFIATIEGCLGKKAIRHNLSMHPGDVPVAWANTSLVRDLTGHHLHMDFRVGVARFIEWYRNYCQK